MSKKDRFAEREAQNYQRPIASREYIMDLLSEHGVPLNMRKISELLNLHDEQDLEALSRRLRAMERDGQVIKNRRNGYGLVEKMDLVGGHVLAHPDGFGFLVPDDGGEDLFLSAKQMRALIHRDRVMARVSGVDRRGRREGVVVEVLQRNTHSVVGRFIREGGVAFVVPDNKRITHDIVVPMENEHGAKNGEIVVVELVEQPTRRRQPIGRVAEILGEHMAPGMEIEVAIRAHDIPFQWPPNVEDAACQISTEVNEAHKKGREDLRNIPLVTIDGEDAKDFDDAVYCEHHGKGWKLIVAIADVANYVQPGHALDDEAQQRGNSVYFPGRVVPMLPEVLSNGLCSLNPKVDRLCMGCEIILSNHGAIKNYRFFEGVMRSHERLIYNDVDALLKGDPQLHQKYHSIVPHLQNLFSLYKQLVKQREKRGAIEFETVETIIKFGQEKKIDQIVPLIRNDAHRLIEECMITANVAAAKYLAKHEMPLLFRVHEPPKSEKLVDLRAFLAERGLQLMGGNDPEPGHYGEVLRQIKGRADWHLIQTVMLRSLNQAVYSPDNQGHFGLSLSHYAHFTSPIRRYPDLLVHRAIKHLLHGGKADNFVYNAEKMASFGVVCSTTERRADDATRDVMDWLKCEYMLDKVGETFVGVITGVTNFGVFVELNDIYVEGLVHVTGLKNDYYHYDQSKHALIGERTHNRYQLADTVSVQVVRVDLDEKRIDFELTEQLSSDVNSHERSKSRRKSKAKSTTKKKRSAKSAKTKKANNKSAKNKSSKSKDKSSSEKKVLKKKAKKASKKVANKKLTKKAVKTAKKTASTSKKSTPKKKPNKKTVAKKKKRNTD